MPITELTSDQSAKAPPGFGQQGAVAGMHPDSNWKSAAESTLTQLSLLRQNWDQYGAPPIDAAVIDAAKMLVLALPDVLAAPPRIVPMSSGNLQFEWHRGRRVLEMEFENLQMIRYLKWDAEKGVEEEHTIAAADAKTALTLIHWFIGENGE